MSIRLLRLETPHGSEAKGVESFGRQLDQFGGGDAAGRVLELDQRVLVLFLTIISTAGFPN